MKKMISICMFGILLLGIFLSIGCVDSDDSETEVTFKIIYTGSWSGSLGGEGSSRSVSGSGTKTFTETGSIFSAAIQKDDDSTNKLTVQIIHDGDVVEESSTTAAYGIASVSWSNL